MAAARKARAPAPSIKYDVVRVAEESADASSLKTYTIVHGKMFIGNGVYLPIGTVISMVPRNAKIHVRAGTIVEGVVEEAIIRGRELEAERLAEEKRAEEED